MRLGCNWRTFESVEDLDRAATYLSRFDVGTVAAPPDLASWSPEECVAFGNAVRERGLTVGEVGYWKNLLARDEAVREERIDHLRALLRRADAMGVDCVVTLVGSMGDDWGGNPHPDNYGRRARERARETVERVLDGLELEHTTYALEPWYNSFFHHPGDVRDFLDGVDDDRLGVHMDAMNMHCVETVYRSTEAIDEMFDLLAEDVVSVHAKDIEMVPSASVVALEERPPGEGAMDYDRYLERLDALDDDLPVFTEHWDDDATFERSLRYLRERADEVGATVVAPRV